MPCTNVRCALCHNGQLWDVHRQESMRELPAVLNTPPCCSTLSLTPIIHVQVVSAKGLRAADSNGLSDPYTVVHLGSRTDQTRVIQENLNPEWHETFVYSADDIQSALMDHMSSLLFEVWDSDFGLIADDFLGQASPLSCASPSMDCARHTSRDLFLNLSSSSGVEPNTALPSCHSHSWSRLVRQSWALSSAG